MESTGNIFYFIFDYLKGDYTFVMYTKSIDIIAKYKQGGMAEWLGRGLQILLRCSNPSSHLLKIYAGRQKYK